MVKRAAVTFAVVCSVAAAGRAAADTHVRLVTPPTMIGDGETHSMLKLQTNGDPAELAGFSLDVDAGTVGAARTVGDGIEVDWVPPRVALPRDVHVAVTAGGVVRSAPVAIAVTPPPRVAGAATSPGALAVHGPAALVLGQDASVEVTLRAPVQPTLAVNVGTLSAPLSDGHGGWRARYTPPAQKFPQVAIVAAAAGDAVDWLTIPLHGVGRVETRTKSYARITLRFGEAAFGPFRTDASGVATTPVVAPPGVHRGTTLAVDALGNTKETPFDLGTPRFSRLLALCNGDKVHLFVADERGRPSEADEPRVVRAGVGSLSAAERVASGHFVARWRPPAGVDSSEVQASLAGDDASQSRCRVRIADAAPVALVIESDRSEFVAGSGALRVRVVERAAGTRPMQPVAVDLAADAGVVEREAAAAGDAPGVTRWRWTLPNRFAGKKRATLTARSREPALSASLGVALVAGPAARVTVDRARGTLAADGSRAALTAHAEDAFGNPARTDRLTASAHATELAVHGGEEGAATVEYVTPSSRRAVDDRVTVRDAASGAGTVVALHVLAPPRPLSLGARVGYLGNFGKISSALVAVDADWHPRLLRRRLALGVSAGVYPGSYRTSDAASGAAVSLAVTGVPLLVRVGYAQPLERFGVYAGIGGGALIARVSTSSASGGASSVTSALGAFEAHAGVDVAVGVGRVALELGWLYAPEGSGAIRGNFGGLAVTAGYRVAL